MAEPIEPAEDKTAQADKPVEQEQKKPVLDSNKPLTQQVDKILANMPEVEEDDKSKDDSKKEEPAPAEKESEKEESEEDESQFIEDDEEDETKPEPVALEGWQKYVLDNLPQIQVVGHEEGKKDKVYTVKRLEELPDDFEFATKRAELAFNAALSAQEVNARELLAKYNQLEAQQNFEKMQADEAIAVQEDIAALQKEGVLPKFKYQVNDSRFNDDPAVKEANEIYELMDKTNKKYLEQYSKTGRTYKISYRDAADKYYAEKLRNAPKNEKPSDKPADKPKQDSERDKAASKVSAPSGADPGSQRRGIRPGTTPQDIYQMYKAGRI